MDIEADTGVTAGAGRRTRLEELYRVHVAPLQRLAFLLTSDHHLAEDITQQAFVKFYRRFFDLRDPAAAPAYLRRAVVNLARSHHRRSRREREHLRAEAPPAEATAERSVEDHDLMVQTLASLPYRQRVAIVLRFYEDLTEQQAADVLGISAAAMKSLTARAMSALRGMNIQGGSDED
ncbi:MAG TPA: SigE family RNA polymerase sigma factor [Actinomycetota bacterium]|nr:SigE family RNA polymerase sigma factor [Actinomycetota bacterium]